MRKFWIANCLVGAMAVGCAGTSGPGMSGGIATSNTPGPMGVAGPMGIAPEIQQTSWTDKVTTSLTNNPVTGLFKDNPQAPPAPPSESIFAKKKQPTPELHVSLAQLSHRQGNLAQARQHYQKALEMDPKNLDALLGAARMEDREGRLDVALMLYTRAADAHPKSATAQNDLALCYARRGDLATAHRMLEQSVRLEPRKALYRNNAAKVLVEMNQVQPAMVHLAAVHTPAVANYNMAILLNDRGRGAEAVPFLAHAVSLDPTMQPAHEMLAHLTAPAPSMGVPNHSNEWSIVAQQQAIPAGQYYSNDSILPTPETVAAAPPATWAVPVAANQPVAEQGGVLPAEQAPMLLPPVN